MCTNCHLQNKNERISANIQSTWIWTDTGTLGQYGLCARQSHTSCSIRPHHRGSLICHSGRLFSYVHFLSSFCNISFYRDWWSDFPVIIWCELNQLTKWQRFNNISERKPLMKDNVFQAKNKNMTETARSLSVPSATLHQSYWKVEDHGCWIMCNQ